MQAKDDYDARGAQSVETASAHHYGALRRLNRPDSLELIEYQALYSQTMQAVAQDLRNWMEVTAALRGIQVPKVSIVLGTGLGSLTSQAEVISRRSFKDCGLPSPSADGHSGEFILANLEGSAVLLQSGRIHCYEEWSSAVVALSVRAQALAGIRAFVLTNAAGSLDAEVSVGDVVLMTGHRGAQDYSPSKRLYDTGGGHLGPFGARFYPVNDTYAPELRARFMEIAIARGFRVHTGVYQFMPGPRFEEENEVRELVRLRKMALADNDSENALIVVGMSTAPEAYALAQLRTHPLYQDIRILGISNVTNKAAGIGGSVPYSEEVLEAGPIGGKKIAEVLKDFLPEIV
jgi:purine-nucleoside phosphorylase